MTDQSQVSQPSDVGTGTGADISQTVSEPSREISDVMKFDPFAPPKAAPTPAEGSEGGEAKPGQVHPESGDASKPQPGAVTPPAQPPAPTQQTPDQLAAAIAANTQAVRDVLAGQQQQQPAPQQPAGPEAAKFNLGIPDQIVTAMGSEDPKERSVALHAVVNGVANHVWKQTETLLRDTVQEILRTVPQIVQSQQQLVARQQEVAQDFYGTYEVFRQPAFVPLMQNIGMQIAQEMVTQGKNPQWNAEMRDAIAGRMFLMFPMLKAQHDAAAATRGNGAAPVKRQPFTTGAGARPAAEPLNEMEQVLKLW